MGISIHPGGASWSYLGFGAFRDRLAEAEGFDLRSMDGFGGEKPWQMSNGASVTTLEPLLNHSDCDGYLDSYDCELVLPRLKAIVATWPAEDYDTVHGLLLIEGMEHCVLHGCSMVFG